MELKIDPELESLIPPLNAEELAMLEQQVKDEGCRDALIGWQEEGALLDGHNRYRICERHGIGYQVKWISLPSREDAKAWMYLHQLGRRNLTDDQRAVIALGLQRERSEIAKRDRAKAGREAGGAATPEQAEKRLSVKTTDKRSEDQPKRDTRREVAKEANVSERKVRAVAEIEKAKPELVKAVADGTKTIRQAKAEIAAEQKPEPAAKSDGPPWEDFNAQVDAIACDLESLALRMGRVLEVKKDNSKGRWSYFLSYQSTVLAARSLANFLRENVPGGPSERPPGYCPARDIKIRMAVRGGK